MSGIGGSGDMLDRLLRLIDDPATFKARIAEHNAAERAAMQANNSLSATRAELDTMRAQLNSDRADLEKTKAVFHTEQAKIQSEFDTEKVRILAVSSKFDEREGNVGKREKAASELEKALKADKTAHTSFVAEKTAELERREGAIAQNEHEIGNTQARIATMEAKLKEKIADIDAFHKKLGL